MKQKSLPALPQSRPETIEMYCLALEKQGRAPKTIRAYARSVSLFFLQFDCLTLQNLAAYRNWLIASYPASTTNVRLCGMNRYLDYLYSCSCLPRELILTPKPASAPALEPALTPESVSPLGPASSPAPENSPAAKRLLADHEGSRSSPPFRQGRDGLYRLRPVKMQKHTYLDNVISQRDYEKLKRHLKKDGELYWYFVVRFLGATGARISELLQIKLEDLELGYLDLYSKGGKVRRLFFPRTLCQEALPYFSARGVDSGFIFLNRRGAVITARGIELQLKKYAVRYRINPDTVYPHSFRHRFAKNFLKRFNDISLLADLMGHDSIETTRIYLTRSSQEQKALIDRVVTW